MLKIVSRTKLRMNLLEIFVLVPYTILPHVCKSKTKNRKKKKIGFPFPFKSFLFSFFFGELYQHPPNTTTCGHSVVDPCFLGL